MVEQSLGIERRRVPLAERYSGGKPGARDRSGSARQHLPRYVEAEQPCAGIGPRQFDEIASGAAADLEHAVPGSRGQAPDRLIAAQEIEFAADVVDMALAAIHAVHELSGVAHAQEASSV